MSSKGKVLITPALRGDKPGKFAWVKKDRLHVDHGYQRNIINAHRVNRIAKDWSWATCGVLTAVPREGRDSKEYWVIDGQQRLSAAKKISSINSLPVMIFELDAKTREAMCFVEVNTERQAVSSMDVFRARLFARDEHAVAIDEMVRQSGYRLFGGGSSTTGGFSSIAFLYRQYAQDSERTTRAWDLATKTMDGASLSQSTTVALFYLFQFLEEIVCPTASKWSAIQRKLFAMGPKGVVQAVHQAVAFYGKTGPSIYAAGLVQAINKKVTQHNRLPNPADGELLKRRNPQAAELFVD